MRNRLVKVLTATLISATMLTGLSTINTEAATKVYLNKKSVTLTQGKTTTLKVKGISKNTKVKYTSNKKSVATVSSKGKITAKKKGVAIISAKFTVKSNKKSVTKVLKCKVTVKAKRVQATKTPKPTSTPRPTATPTVKPTNTVAPTATPEPTATVVPTATPEPTATAVPTETVEPTEVPVVTSVPTEAPIEVAPTEIPVHVHDYNARYEVIQESTCTEDGLMNMYCECGECIQKVIKPYHHNAWIVGGSDYRLLPSEIATAPEEVLNSKYHLLPTETSDGYIHLDCEDCGEDVTFSERTTFPALTDENYPLDGWVYEKHDYMYPKEIREKYGWYKVDRHHNAPYILVTDYIGTKENPTLKGSYVIDGTEYQVIIRTLKCSSPTVQCMRLYGIRCENPDLSALYEKRVCSFGLGGEDSYADFDWSL